MRAPEKRGRAAYCNNVPHIILRYYVGHTPDAGDIDVVNYQYSAFPNAGVEVKILKVGKRITVRPVDQNTIVKPIMLERWENDLRRAEMGRNPRLICQGGVAEESHAGALIRGVIKAEHLVPLRKIRKQYGRSATTGFCRLLCRSSDQLFEHTKRLVVQHAGAMPRTAVLFLRDLISNAAFRDLVLQCFQCVGFFGWGRGR